MNESDITVPAAGEPMRVPSAEEFRMVRAITLLALQEATHYGVYRASFKGFRVQALRQPSAPGSDAYVEVNLRVSLGNAVVESGVVAMDIPQPCAKLLTRPGAATADASAIEPISRATVI